ncbi:hypothetical protein FACS189464_2630 [Bacteroidia bacterium]|nr:hypothetical protein FACS189430_08590 [Bacteroidia bacterium]GHT78718.1 hypothetical protein FACS189464_2630 [Bacteroidia bacterium]
MKKYLTYIVIVVLSWSCNIGKTTQQRSYSAVVIPPMTETLDAATFKLLKRLALMDDFSELSK